MIVKKTGLKMLDFLIILLIAFIVLLIVQIIALLRIRHFINYLRNAMMHIGYQVGYYKNKHPVPVQTCQFCKYRLTYIKAGLSGTEQDFYYSCKLTRKQVSLTDSCSKFVYDPEA